MPLVLPILEIITLIGNLRHTKIIWLDGNERQPISTVLQNRSGRYKKLYKTRYSYLLLVIPVIIGLIGACHIPIKAPPRNNVD